MTLPTVTLVDGAYYWVRPRYDESGPMIVCEWRVGSFWKGNEEIVPAAISGPIPTPDEVE